MDRFTWLMIGLLVGGVVISTLLAKFVKVKWIWYIPSFIGVAVIIYLAYKIKFTELEGFLDLGYFLTILMIVAFIMGNILTNIIIHIKKKNKENRKDNSK